MTTIIEPDQRHEAVPTPEGSPIRTDRDRLVVGTWAVLGCGITGGAALLAVDITRHDDIRFAIFSTLLLAIAAMAAMVLAIERMLASREQFYRRGHLMGWMRGWNGQEPLKDDPLLH